VENHCTLIAPKKSRKPGFFGACGFFALVKYRADGYNLIPSQSDTPRTLAL
jgi:hypothetical protein